MAHTNNLPAPTRSWRIFLTAAIITVISISQAYAQQNRIDSLETLLPQKQGEERLETLEDLTLLTEDLPEQKRYIDMYLEEARRQGNVELEGDALFKLSYFYYYRFDTDTFFTVTGEAIRFNLQHGLYETLSILRQNLIKRYHVQGQIFTAIREAEEAYAEARELQENMYMARMLEAMGEIYLETGQNGEALRCFSEAVALARQKREQDTYFFINTYYCLASVAGYLNRFDETLMYADSMRMEIDRLRQSRPDFNLQLLDFMVEAHRSVAFASLGHTEQSFQAIGQAESLFDPQWKDTSNEIILDDMYAEYYMATGDYDRALEHIRRAKQFYEENQLGSSVLRKKNEEADVLSDKGDYRTATGIYRQIIAEKDSLHSENIYTQLNELRTLYELDKAELEAARRLETIRRQRLYIIGATLACLALAVIVALEPPQGCRKEPRTVPPDKRAGRNTGRTGSRTQEKPRYRGCRTG